MTDFPIIVFAKPPVAGVAKTRLIPALGETGAAQLHARLLEQTIKIAVKASQTVYLFTAMEHEHEAFIDLQSRYAITLLSQADGDLGARMRDAFARVGPALLIGTDCPNIDAALLVRCALALQHHDAVFVSAEDGGYALIGLHQPFDELFNGIPWSSAQVMPKTVERLHKLQLRWLEVAQLWDVDTPDDYERLCVHFPDLCK